MRQASPTQDAGKGKDKINADAHWTKSTWLYQTFFPAISRVRSSQMPQGHRLRILILKPIFPFFCMLAVWWQRWNWVTAALPFQPHKLQWRVNFSGLCGAQELLLWDMAAFCFPAGYKSSICLMGKLLLSQNPAPQGQVIMAQASQWRQISVWCSSKKIGKTERNHNIEQVQYECRDAPK